MATIQVYLDETKCNKNTFQVDVLICGSSNQCEHYEEQIRQIVEENVGILGKDFKAFHAKNLNEKNWHTIGNVFLKVIDKLFEFARTGTLKILVCLEAKEKYQANIAILKNLIKSQLENKNSPVGSIFKTFEKEDLPAFYHRIDQLMIYLMYRDKLGKAGDQFEFYPDATGKILQYRDKEFRVAGRVFTGYLEFYDLIVILANLSTKIPEALQLKGWPQYDQKLIKFQPLKDQESYLIQACDIISNFFYNFLRYQVGLIDKKSKLKSDALTTRRNLSHLISTIGTHFDIKDQDVICVNSDLRATVELF